MAVRDLLKNRVVATTLAVYALFMAVLLAATLPGLQGLPDEFQAFDFKLDDVFGGKDVTLAEHGGRPVIIYFFASW